MRIRKPIYANGLIILAAALLGWLVGYYVRWDPEKKRPYIERPEVPEPAVETSTGSKSKKS